MNRVRLGENYVMDVSILTGIVFTFPFVLIGALLLIAFAKSK